MTVAASVSLSHAEICSKVHLQLLGVFSPETFSPPLSQKLVLCSSSSAANSLYTPNIEVADAGESGSFSGSSGLQCGCSSRTSSLLKKESIYLVSARKIHA